MKSLITSLNSTQAEHSTIPTDAEVIAYVSTELLPALSDMSDAHHEAVNEPGFNPHIKAHFQNQLPELTQSLTAALVYAPETSDTTSRLYQLIKHHYDTVRDMMFQAHSDFETEGMYIIRDVLANSSELLETALIKIKPKLT